jgi:hypothetical protein
VRKSRRHLPSDHWVEMRQPHQEPAQSLRSHGQVKPVQEVLGTRSEVPLERADAVLTVGQERQLLKSRYLQISPTLTRGVTRF